MFIADFEEIVIPMNFGIDEDGMETPEVEDVIIQAEDLDKDKDIDEWRFGASKLVFLFKDYVVKLPFNGVQNYVNDEEEYVFDPYYTEDYCALELSIYHDAKAEGLEKFFTATELAGYTKDHTPFYKAERVYSFYSSKRKEISEDSLCKASSIRKNYHCGGLDIDWLAAAIDFYGEELTNDFINFIEEHGIGDLHNDNIGYREDGSPVLLDYSGFDW